MGKREGTWTLAIAGGIPFAVAGGQQVFLAYLDQDGYLTHNISDQEGP